MYDKLIYFDLETYHIEHCNILQIQVFDHSYWPRFLTVESARTEFCMNN